MKGVFLMIFSIERIFTIELMTISKFLTLSILLCFTINIVAQDPLSKDVRVVREFTPTVSDAMKINQMPDREDTLDIKPAFSYRVIGHAMVSTPDVEALSAARLARPGEDHLYPSYIRGGIGNYQTLFGDIFYNVTRNEKYAFALMVGQESSWGELDLETGDPAEAPYHQTDGGVYLRHFFDDKTLEFDLNFDRHAYRYYGLQTIDPEALYESEPVAGEQLIPDRKQRQTGFDLHFGLAGQQSDLRETRYHLNFDYGAFNNFTGVGENKFALTGDLKLPFGALSLHADGGISYYKVNVPTGDNSNPALWTFDEREQIFMTMNPRVVIPGNKLSIEVGVNVTGEFSGIEQFYLSPHVKGDLVIAEGIVSTFAGMSGEVRPAGYRSMMADNPFLSPDVRVKTAFSNIRGFAGVTGNFSSATSFTARLDYEYIEDEHFFVNRFFERDDETGVYDQSNLFDVVYSDATLLTLSGELLMRPMNELSIILKGAYFGWDLDLYDYAWHKPEMEIGLRASYTLDQEWQFDAAFNVLGERNAYDKNNVGVAKKLGAITDFNLGANYQYNKRLHFFGRIQNIFAAKYYRWSGYPMQGINLRVGAGYAF